jgi:hypothetical protein
MTTDELLRIVEQRGLRVVLKDGQPVICGAKSNPAATERLLAVLRLHRERIIAMLKSRKVNT